MNYCFYVKAIYDIPDKLLKTFQIPETAITYKGISQCIENLASERFVEEIVNDRRKIENMLKTNVSICLTRENEENYNMILKNGRCPVCSGQFITPNNPCSMSLLFKW